EASHRPAAHAERARRSRGRVRGGDGRHAPPGARLRRGAARRDAAPLRPSGDGRRQVLGLQARADAGRRGARVPGRQRLRRGVHDAAPLPRGAAQLDLGRLRQRDVPRRPARHGAWPRGGGGVLRRGGPRARRRSPARRLRGPRARGARRRRSGRDGGRARAARLAARGWTVSATARRPEAIRALGSRGCRTLALDVCDEASMRAAVETIERAEGAVGVLINNAGYGQEGAFEEVPMAEVRRQFETNVFGLVRLTQLVLPGMRRQGWGRVVNLSSMGGRLTLPGGAYYHATKYAVEALSDALRFEVKPFGIDVVVIEPGPIKTRFGDT